MRHHQWNHLFAVEQDTACDAHLRDTIRRVQAEADSLNLSAKPTLSFAGLIVKQLKFLAWKIWVFQGMVLAALCAVFFTTYTAVFNPWNSAGLTKYLCLCSVAVVISSLPLQKRAVRYRMFELEQATHFAIRGSLLSQLLFIGIGDLIMLAVPALLVLKCGLTISVTLLSLVVPFLTAAVCCVMLWARVDPALFQTAGIALCLLSSLLCYVLIDKSSVITPTARYCLFTGYCLVCLAILYRECRRLYLHRPVEKLLS